MVNLKINNIICEPNFISAMMKTKIQNLLCKKQNHQIFFVHSKKSTENRNVDNEVINEPKHLITYRTIWKVIHVLAKCNGLSAYKQVEINLGNFGLIMSISLISIAFSSIFYASALNWHNIKALLEIICLLGILIPVRMCWYFIHAVSAPKIRIISSHQKLI